MAKPGRAQSEGMEQLAQTYARELQRQAEELRETYLQMQTERRRYRHLFDEAPDAYLLTDHHGQIRELNDAAARVLGRPLSQCAGKPVFAFMGMQERALARRTLALVIQDHMHRTITVQMGAGGEQLSFFEARLSTWSEGNGRTVMVRWILRDLSVLKRADEAERERERLQLANQAKDELLGLVSHELRTPLTIIIGASRALDRVMANESIPEVRELVDDIVRSSERLRSIVDNMLTLARAENHGEASLEPVLLQRVLPTTLAREGRIYWDRKLEVELPANLPPVMAAPVFVDQIIQNLISNAVKYGSADCPIRVQAQADSKEVSVTVANGGARVDIDFDRLFQPFYRARSTASQVGGAGLGLSACRRLAVAQGGRIEARPLQPGGLAVTFHLQVVVPEER